jgi:MFS family permease
MRAIGDRHRWPLPVALRAFRHRDYRLFMGGQAISLIGTWMQTVAQSWLVYRLTGSAALLGLVGFATQIPVFLLGPIAGSYADRVDRRQLLLRTQASMMVLALTLALLTMTGLVAIWHLFVLGALLGVANAFDIPGRQVFVFEIVGREDLVNAIALNSSMVNGARIVGPAVAGLLVSAVGEGWCFLLNGLSYLAVIAGLAMVKTRTQAHPPEGSPLEAIREGLTFVARTAPIRALLVLLGIVSLAGMPYTVLMPVIADRVLHAGASGYGILMGATGVGAIAAALTLASRRTIRGLGSWVAGGCALFGLSLAIFASVHTFWIAGGLLTLAGFSMMVQMASSNTLIQSMVPDRLRGRVMAVYSMMFMGMAPFGALLAGTVAEPLGPSMTVGVGGALCLLAAVIFARRLPVLRPEARRLILAQQAAAGQPEEGILPGAAATKVEK